jgi:hypothetical protein
MFYWTTEPAQAVTIRHPVVAGLFYSERATPRLDSSARIFNKESLLP